MLYYALKCGLTVDSDNTFNLLVRIIESITEDELSVCKDFVRKTSLFKTIQSQMNIKIQQLNSTQKRSVKIRFNPEAEIDKLFKLFKDYVHQHFYEEAKMKKIRYCYVLIIEKLVKPCLCFSEYFNSFNIAYYYLSHDEKKKDIIMITSAYLEKIELVLTGRLDSRKIFSSLTNLNAFLPIIKDLVSPGNFINFLSILFASLVKPDFKGLNQIIFETIINILACYEQNPDSDPLYCIVQSNSQIIEDNLKNRSDWRKFELTVLMLTSASPIYNSEAFNEKIILVSKEFFNALPKSRRSIPNNQLASGSNYNSEPLTKESSNKDLKLPQQANTAQSNLDYNNSKIIKNHIDLSVYLIRVSSNKNREEILSYTNKYLLTKSFYEQRYLFYFYELIISNFSFAFFNKNGLLTTLLSLVNTDNSSAMWLGCLTFCKRFIHFIMETLELQDLFNFKVEQIKKYLAEKKTHCNTDKQLNLEIEELDLFMAEVNKQNFDHAILGDNEKFEKIQTFFEERNCIYLFTKSDKNGISMLIGSSKRGKLPESPKYKSSSNVISTKRFGGSFKGNETVNDPMMSERPFSPITIKSMLAPLKNSSIKKNLNASNTLSSKVSDAKRQFEAPNLEMFSKGKITEKSNGKFISKKTEIILKSKDEKPDRPEKSDKDPKIDSEPKTTLKISSNIKKYSLKVNSHQGSLTAIDTKLLSNMFKSTGSSKLISSSKK